MPSELILSKCTGEFGCNCPTLRFPRERSLANLRGHGSRKKYQNGCRCTPCTRANAKYQREYRQKDDDGAS